MDIWIRCIFKYTKQVGGIQEESAGNDREESL